MWRRLLAHETQVYFFLAHFIGAHSLTLSDANDDVSKQGFLFRNLSFVFEHLPYPNLRSIVLLDIWEQVCGAVSLFLFFCFLFSFFVF